MTALDVSAGHGITHDLLDQLCAQGAFTPTGKRVLLEAIFQEESTTTGAMLSRDAKGERMIDARDAIAFRVAAIGCDVPTSWGFAVDDVVINTSISGERVNSVNKNSPWRVVHHEDVVIRASAEAVGRLVAERRTAALKLAG